MIVCSYMMLAVVVGLGLGAYSDSPVLGQAPSAWTQAEPGYRFEFVQFTTDVFPWQKLARIRVEMNVDDLSFLRKSEFAAKKNDHQCQCRLPCRAHIVSPVVARCSSALASTLATCIADFPARSLI